MESHNDALLTIGIAMMVGVLCQAVARHLRFPAIILLLAAGAGIGAEGLHWVEPRSLGSGLFGLVEMGIAIILFEGGLNLQSSRLRRQERPIRFLVTIGALVTLIGAAAAAYWIMEWPWQLAVLFGSLVIVTGPTVVTPLLRDLRLHPRVKTILEAEGVLIDPIGAIAASIALQIVMAPSVTDELSNAAVAIVQRLGFGAIAGILGGLLLGGIMKVRPLIPHGLHNIFALAFVLLLFTGCEAVFLNSGIMAVTVSGVVFGWVSRNSQRELHEFKDQLTILLVGTLFILLAADIRLNDVLSLGRPGILVIVALVFVVRPLCAFISTAGSNLNAREKIFIGWIAPRGIVAAAITSLTADVLAQREFGDSDQLRGLVFLTIASTVVLAGLTARPLATLLNLRLPNRNRVAILSADGLSVVLGNELKRRNVPVVFVDSDPKRCQMVQDMGHTVVYGNALEERTLARAQFDLVATAVGLTQNDHLNSLFVSHAREDFGVPNGLVAVEKLSEGKVPQHVRKVHADVLFEGPHDYERWDVRWRHGQVKLDYVIYKPAEKTVHEEPDLEQPSPVHNENFVILGVARGASFRVMSFSLTLRKNDIAAVAFYEPEFDEAIKQLRTLGWHYPAANAVPSKETA